MLTERIAAALLCLSALCLSACSFVTDNTTEVKKDLADYTTAKHMLDGIDAAYDTDYSKFTLPDNDALHITHPEGVYELTLEVINADGNKEWENQKNKELAAVFDTSNGVEACVVVSGAYYIKATPHKDRLKALYATYLHLFRHITHFFLEIR
ncbi:hypothetical protein [Ruminococcus sp. NK3A76]|uniref:hypothetical protein n=1 Tax=Ruminococcus sp. NK3A76 TaxID=877411 RepID=UPI00048CA500|nr:hypothetical protein [Ruminococcus sp. NK3A76]